MDNLVMRTNKPVGILTHIKTNPAHVVDEVQIKYEFVRLRVGMMTGNWHPEGNAWAASVHADKFHYSDSSNWSFGLGDWGASRDEAIRNVYEFAKRQTLNFPDDWLEAIINTLDEEYAGC